MAADMVTAWARSLLFKSLLRQDDTWGADPAEQSPRQCAGRSTPFHIVLAASRNTQCYAGAQHYVCFHLVQAASREEHVVSSLAAKVANSELSRSEPNQAQPGEEAALSSKNSSLQFAGLRSHSGQAASKGRLAADMAEARSRSLFFIYACYKATPEEQILRLDTPNRVQGRVLAAQHPGATGAQCATCFHLVQAASRSVPGEGQVASGLAA